MRTVEFPSPCLTSSFSRLSSVHCRILCSWLIRFGDPSSVPEPKSSVSNLSNPPTAYVHIHSFLFSPAVNQDGGLVCQRLDVLSHRKAKHRRLPSQEYSRKPSSDWRLVLFLNHSLLMYDKINYTLSMPLCKPSAFQIALYSRVSLDPACGK